MLAHRAPLAGIGLATAVTAVLALPSRQPPRYALPPAIALTGPLEPVDIRAQYVELCDQRGVTTVVVNGQFTAHGALAPESFAIELPGRDGIRFSAVTDNHGYFEMRIPREDFAAADLCAIPTDWDGRFSDSEMTLSYRISFER